MMDIKDEEILKKLSKPKYTMNEIRNKLLKNLFHRENKIISLNVYKTIKGIK